MKRLISCYPSDLIGATRQQLKQAIQASEGRTIMAETVVTAAPLIEGVTNAEVMAAFGADLLVLNEFDVFSKKINGHPQSENPIADMKYLTGKLIGINLEPLDQAVKILDQQVHISKGRQASVETFKAANDLGMDYLILTGNPSTGVSVKAIKEAIELGREHFNGLLFAGKMHGAGIAEKLVDVDVLKSYIELGADGVLIPTVGTVPGLTEQEVHAAVQEIKKINGLVIHTIGTSQESADDDVIKDFALSNKRMGGDIHHIGDGAYGRTPPPENILKLSTTIRGKRHTYFKMAQSIRR